MRLSDHQAIFTRDISLLVLWAAEQRDWRVRFREVYRPTEMQRIYVERGLSWTMNSYHHKSLAADLVLDIGGVYQTDSNVYRPLGVEWERMSTHNVWGGRFSDGNHFERHREPRSSDRIA